MLEGVDSSSRNFLRLVWFDQVAKYQIETFAHEYSKQVTEDASMQNLSTAYSSCLSFFGSTFVE